MLPENILNALTDIFKAYPAIDQVFLYGSHAKGTAHALSDYDLALTAPALSDADFARIRYSVTYELPTLIPAEIARLDGANPAFKKHILEKGVIIYERK